MVLNRTGAIRPLNGSSVVMEAFQGLDTNNVTAKELFIDHVFEKEISCAEKSQLKKGSILT